MISAERYAPKLALTKAAAMGKDGTAKLSPALPRFSGGRRRGAVT